MTLDDNTVNMKSPKRGYHHGDLRSALITAGVELLTAGSADTLSLRQVARAVGVSPTAVYRHFPDKQALLYAICEHTSDALSQAQSAAAQAAGGGAAGFAATGQAYVRFALDHPTSFRLLMSTRPPKDHFAGETTHAHAAMRLLRENVAALLPAGASNEAQRRAAIQAWALVHGMAMLMLDGQIEADDALIASVASPIGSAETCA